MFVGFDLMKENPPGCWFGVGVVVVVDDIAFVLMGVWSFFVGLMNEKAVLGFEEVIFDDCDSVGFARKPKLFMLFVEFTEISFKFDFLIKPKFGFLASSIFLVGSIKFVVDEIFVAVLTLLLLP